MSEIGWSDWLSMMASFAVVITLLAVTLYSLKKLNPGLGKSATKTLNVTEVHHLGPRQKLMLVTVNKQQVLLGVTPQAINHLGTWDDVQQLVEFESPEQPQEKTSVADKFQKMLAQVRLKAKD